MLASLVTVYNPDCQTVDNINTYAASVDKVFVCDNSPHDNKELFSSINNLSYIYNNGNLGISGAFNRVLKDKNYCWNADDNIIFFDQDSRVKQGHVEKLLKLYERLEKRYRVGCIGPSYFNLSNGKLEYVKGRQIGKTLYEVPTVITSSMLTSYSALKAVDFFNEKIFLDYSDWDLCWRWTSNGYKVFTTKAVVFDHNVGNNEVQAGLIKIRKWDPVRTYYQVRDGRYLLSQKYVSYSYRIRLLYMTRLLPLMNIKYLDKKGERRHYYKKAISDYQNGIYGEINE